MRGAQKQAGQSERKNEAIKAHPAGLEGDHFVVLGESRQRDQAGHQGGQRRELVEHQRNQVEEIVDHDDERDVVLGDVAEQIEKCEGVKNQNESGEENSEVVDELPQNVDVDHHRETGRCCAARRVGAALPVPGWRAV